MRTPDGNAMTEPALTAKQTGDNICKHNATENVYQAEPNGSEKATIEQISSLNKIRLLYFFFRFSTGSLVPFMPMFMQHCGFNNEDIGKLQAIRPVITMVGAPCWGGLADRTGKKKMLLITTFLMSSICRLSVSLFKDDVQLFAIALCSTSLFYSAVSSLLDSIVISSLNSKERLNFGKLRLWGELGNGLSSTLMMHLSNSESYGFQYLFILHAITAVVAVAFMLSCTPSNQRNKKEIKQTNENENLNKNCTDWKRSVLEAFTNNAEMTSIFITVAVTGFSMAMLENFCYINIKTMYQEHGQEERIGREISMYRMLYTFGGVLAWWFSGAWNKRLGPNGVIIASVCLIPPCMFSYAGVGAGLDLWTKMGFFVAEAIRSAIFAALWSSATIRVNNICPPHMTAVVQSVMEASYRGLGHTSGAYFGGVLCKKFGIANAFRLVAKCLVSLLCTLGALFLSSQLRSNVPKSH